MHVVGMRVWLPVYFALLTFYDRKIVDTGD